MSPQWFAGIYENHFQYQVNKDILTRQSICGSFCLLYMLEGELRELSDTAERVLERWLRAWKNFEPKWQTNRQSSSLWLLKEPKKLNNLNLISLAANELLEEGPGRGDVNDDDWPGHHPPALHLRPGRRAQHPGWVWAGLQSGQCLNLLLMIRTNVETCR